MMNEKLSDWVDGELEQEEGRRVLQSIMRSESDRQACELYWLIGDTLRGAVSEAGLDVRIGSRVMAVLENEPTVLAPRGADRVPPVPMNRWFSAVAALGGVAVVGWMSMSLLGSGSEASHSVASAAIPEAVVLPVAAASVPAQGGLGGEQAYYLAHQAAAIGAPIPGVAQYIRTVGDEQVGQR